MSLKQGDAGTGARIPTFVCALVVVLAACSTPIGDTDGPRRPGSANDTAERARPSREASAARPVPAPRPQASPRDWRRVPWIGGGRRVAPDSAAGLPSVLDDPARARMAYHPTERIDDPGGWAGERLFFLGVDDRWRRLDMDDLGLPEESWPGADTYGPGSLSRDGRLWAAHTHGGAVVVDLTSGAVRRVPFPAGRSHVVRVDWIPGGDVLSAYAARPESSTYDTLHVDARGRVTPVRYPGWRTRFDVDGTPVEIIGASRRQLRVERWADDGLVSTTLVPGVEVPRSMRRHAFGVFGATDVALYAHRGWPSPASAQVWVLDKNSGAMAARLRVPATSSIVGWTDDDRLRLLIANRRVVEWEPRTGRIRQVLDLPGPYPGHAEWAAATVAFPSP
jgi:hypothetical protein